MYQLSCLISHITYTHKVWKPRNLITSNRQDNEIEIIIIGL